MRLEIQKGKLGICKDILEELPVRGGTKSRHRTRIVKIIKNQMDEVEEQRIEIATEYANKDEKGNPIIVDGYYDLTSDDLVEVNRAYKELMGEMFIISGDNEQEYLKTLKEVLLSSNEVYEGERAQVYDDMCSSLEESDKEEE